MVGSGTGAGDNEQAPAGDHGDAEVPTAATSTTIRDVTTSMPRQIGRYRIRQLLSAGGMGPVCVAVQEQPRRTVAIKLMKHGIASRLALRPFEFESQIPQFDDGKPSTDQAMLQSCFDCHQAINARDFVFTHDAP